MKQCNELALAGLLAAAGAAQAQELDPALMALAQQETPAVLETLRALTAPDSGTGQAGMAAVADVIERFAGDLGGQVQRLAPANGVAGPNLVITFKGTGKRRIMLMSHMDTVYPAGTAAARPLRVDGNRAIAPGIADDKGGIAVFLHAMKLLKARGFQDYERVTMVFNSDEERGSGGSRELIRSQAQAHDAVLSGEPTSVTPEGIVLGTSGVAQLSARVRVGGPFGSAGERPIEELADLVLRTREVQQQVAETRMNWTVMRAEDGGTLHKLPADQWQFSTLRFHVKGRASHAGVAPAAGINAVVETAAVVKRASEAAARFPDVRVHWRLASGGLVPNIIPDRGQAVAEVAVPKGSDPAPVLEALSRAGTQNMLAGAQVEAQGMAGLGERPSGSGEALASADIRIPNQEAFQQIGRAAREKIE
ncbi:MAG TPA: M20/M25/M40 family metallo-hydrolase, partial [Ramlibacter sp.]|nr:M20/M25/M40 family metallo-hydrolase [Ramlibacter sp.]